MARRKSTGRKDDSPLTQKQRELEAERRRIQQDLQRAQRVLEVAPKIAAEQRRRKQEELLRNKNHAEARFGVGPVLRDPRFVHEVDLGTATRIRRLKKHKRQGMFTFFVLCGVFIATLFWVWWTVIRHL